MAYTRHYKNWFLVILIISFCQNMTFAQQSIQLLVRADDMGITHDVNLGIIKAHKEGIVTSASLMPTSAYFEEAVRLCKENPTLAPGLHITIVDGSQRPVLSPEEVPSLVTPRGFFYEGVGQLSNENPIYEEMEKEIRAQVRKARESGLHFVYLDWHRGGDYKSEAGKMRTEIVRKLCREKNLILGTDKESALYGGYQRIKFQPAGVVTGYETPDGRKIYYPAPAYTEEVKQSFFDVLSGIEPGRWWATTHPGMYKTKGDLTELLCDPRTLEIIKERNIQLVSYADLWQEKYETVK